MVKYKFSNVVITSCCFFGLLLCIIPIASAIYIFVEGPVSCEDDSPVWTLSLGIFLLVMSLVGLIGATAKSRIMMLIYMYMLSLVILTFIGLVLFTVVVMKTSPADVEKANRDYELKEFIPMVRKYVVSDAKWVETKKCLIQQGFCKKRIGYVSDDEEETAKQRGCCTPPTKCGFEKRNESLWVVPEKSTRGLVSKEYDCLAWSNNVDKMCYDCDSCKAGHVVGRVIEINGDFGFCIGFSIFLLIIFLFAFWAMKNNSQKDESKGGSC